jgi:hypothetical protein
MKQPTEEIYRALIMLQNQEAFLTIKQWMSESLSELDKDNRRIQDSNRLHQQQGQAQALEDILFELDGAKENLAVLVERTKQRTLHRRP